MKFSLPFVSLLLASHCAYAQSSLSDLAERLDSTECYTARATYEVLLPNSESPVRYNISLMSYPTVADTISPCEYLVRWQPVMNDSTMSMNGFASYYGGNFFRFSSGKLVEYHASESMMPFAPNGSAAGGVQQKEQFASILPQFLAKELHNMATDSSYTITISARASGTELKGSQTRRGYLCSEFTYCFNRDGLPTFKEITTNPGQIGEQVITVIYNYNSSPTDCHQITERTLIDDFPDIFDKYRRDSFTLENLRDEPLPSFAVATTYRSRLSHQRGDPLDALTVIAVLDSSVDATPIVVSNLRAAINALPYSASLILAFIDKDTEAITATTGPARPGEIILVSARALARNCGVTDFPSFIFCRPDGTVSDIHIGRSDDLPDIILQKAALANSRL